MNVYIIQSSREAFSDNILTTLLALSRIETARPSHKMLWILSLCAFRWIALIHKPQQRASLYHIFTDLTAAPPRPITTSSAAKSQKSSVLEPRLSSWRLKLQEAQQQEENYSLMKSWLYTNSKLYVKLEIKCALSSLESSSQVARKRAAWRRIE